METQTIVSRRSELRKKDHASAGSVPRGSLLKAFEAFTEVAGSLESSYLQLERQVERLHLDLSEANADLERSLDENRNIRAYLAQLLEALPCGVLVADAAKNLKFANPAARRMLLSEDDGAQPAAAERNRLLRLLAVLPDVISECEPEFEWEEESGRTQSIAVAQACLSSPHGDGFHNVYILRDTTEQKRFEQQQESNRKLQALAEMAMILAHEIRNPLGSLELFAGLLADATQQQPVMRQWVEHLQAGLRSLGATVNNVLQFHSQPPAEMTSIHLVRLLKDTVEFLHPLARQKGIEVQLFCCHPDIFVAADSHRLQQVFFNLSMNSFRVIPRGTALEIRVRWSEERPQTVLEIEFEDHGPGIAPELKAKIFDPGFTTTPGSPGLGLAVCKKIVEQHGGTIRVDHEFEKGAKFVIALPVSGAARAAAQGPPLPTVRAAQETIEEAVQAAAQAAGQGAAQ